MKTKAFAFVNFIAGADGGRWLRIYLFADSVSRDVADIMLVDWLGT
jgi:hypothetical protein